jgi:hypothetical protein
MKVKLFLCLINEAKHHEDVRGAEGIALSFLSSAVDEVSGQLHPPATLPIPRYPWVSPSAGLDAMEKRKILHLPGIEPRPCSPWSVAIPTELSRLFDRICSMGE